MSEAIQLRRDQVAMNAGAVYVYAAPVLKHKERSTRDIMIPNNLANPLFPEFRDYLERCQTVYLLPAYKRKTHELIPDRHTARSTVYVKLQEIDPSLYPHQLRAWSAGMLVEEHGLNVFDLQQWFNWKSADTPTWYARTRERDLEVKLGIRDAPKLRDRPTV